VTSASLHGQPLKDWLADRHRDLCESLSQFLAQDAGLRETTMLHAEHADLLGALDSSLDTQVGLAAILSAPVAATSQTPPGLLSVAAAIEAADPAVRVALRRDPVILAVILSDLTVRALVVANETLTGRALDLGHALACDLALARDLVRALNLDIDLGRDLDLGRARARDLDLSGDLACGLALDLARGLARALDLALDLARADGRVLDLGRALDLARGLARGRGRALGLARALGVALDITDQAVMAVGRALGVQQVEGLATALLEGALDDFTNADLTRVDLSGRNLTGVRWSDWGTRWPPGTDVDWLQARSREVAPDTGIYVIGSRGDSDKSLRHAPA
jgi:hypothetical protein